MPAIEKYFTQVRMFSMEPVTQLQPKEQYQTNVVLLKDCPLCQSKKIRPIKTEQNKFYGNEHPEVLVFDKVWVQLLKCDDCSFAFCKEIPSSSSFFQNRYDNHHFDPEAEVGHVRKSEIVDEIFNRFASYGVSTGKLLDIGSFAGQLLRNANERGFEPHGAELNPKLAKFTKEKLGFNVFQGEFQKLDIEGQNFDAITIIDVLEHLVDPMAVIATIAKGLRSGGLAYIKVPNYPMQILKQNIANIFGVSDQGVFATFAHINHFSIESIEKALDRVGMELVHVSSAKSEKWHKGKSLYWARNFFRSFYWKASGFIYSVTGISIALNHNFVARKK